MQDISKIHYYYYHHRYDKAIAYPQPWLDIYKFYATLTFLQEEEKDFAKGNNTPDYSKPIHPPLFTKNTPLSTKVSEKRERDKGKKRKKKDQEL